MANPVELKKRVGNQQGERQQVNEIAVGNLEKQGLTLSVVVYPPPTPTERHESDSVVSLLQFQSSQESLAHQPGSLPTGFFLSTEAVVFFPKGGGKKEA